MPSRRNPSPESQKQKAGEHTGFFERLQGTCPKVTWRQKLHRLGLPQVRQAPRTSLLPRWP